MKQSIYQQVLGDQFAQLHPKIQERFGFCSKDGVASIGEGVMDEVWHGKAYTIPFLKLGSSQNIMFPEKGKKVPFTVENYAYEDSFGRETVTWIRKFHFRKKVKRFDATMIYSKERGKIIDYLGTHQRLAVDLDISVAENGGIKIRSGAQRLYLGFIGFNFPMFFSGYADVCEWYDDEENKYRISVKVNNPFWGDLFGYSGRFDVKFIKGESLDIPEQVKPFHEEIRE